MNGKSNLRQITKAEVRNLEQMKLDVLCNTELMSKVNQESVQKTLASNPKAPVSLKTELARRGITLDEMSIKDFRANAVSLFLELMC